MQQPGKIAEYLEAVRQQIRWKRAQPSVLEEINNHIADQRNAFLREGLNEEEATNKALAEMGDPIVVGEQLDRAHRPRPDWPLLVTTVGMLLLGIAIQILIGPKHISNGAEMFQKQIVCAGIATLVMMAAYFTDFTILGKFPKAGFFGLCVIMGADYLITRVHISSIYAINLLLLFPAVYAGFVYKMRNKGYGGFMLCGVMLIIPAYLSLLDPRWINETIFLVLSISGLTILTAAVTKGWFKVRKIFAMLMMYTSAAVILPALFLLMSDEGYVARKIQPMSNPAIDPTGYGYIGTVVQQSLFHSQFIGEGSPISNFEVSTAAQFLSATANTDFLLTYLIYRFGWIMLIGTVVIFSLFIIRAAILCRKQKVSWDF